LLTHPTLVPPDSPAPKEVTEAEWKAEYQVISGLKDMGHECTPLGLLDDLESIRALSLELEPHIAFNLTEEFGGLSQFDAHVVSYLEAVRLPYTGCNPRGLVLARDKAVAKKLLRYHGIRTPDFAVFRRHAPVKRPAELGFPLIVKSVTEEASLGISLGSVVSSDRALEERVRFVHESVGTDAFAESFIDGRELYVGVLGNHRPEFFPVWEMFFPESNGEPPRIATRRVKWDAAYRDRHGIRTGPADLPPSLRDEASAIAREAYQVLGLNGYARMDLRLSPGGQLYLIEANPNPHIGADEDFAASAAAAGIDYETLLGKILSLGLRWEPESRF